MATFVIEVPDEHAAFLVATVNYQLRDNEDIDVEIIEVGAEQCPECNEHALVTLCTCCGVEEEEDG